MYIHYLTLYDRLWATLCMIVHIVELPNSDQFLYWITCGIGGSCGVVTWWLLHIDMLFGILNFISDFIFFSDLNIGSYPNNETTWYLRRLGHFPIADKVNRSFSKTQKPNALQFCLIHVCKQQSHWRSVKLVLLK